MWQPGSPRGGGWEGWGGWGRRPEETLPEHLDRTSTVAGPSVVCTGAVRSGAVIGGRLGGGGTDETRPRPGWSRLPPAGRAGGPSSVISRAPPWRDPAPLRAGPRHTTNGPATVLVRPESSGTVSLGWDRGCQGWGFQARVAARSSPGHPSKRKYGPVRQLALRDLTAHTRRGRAAREMLGQGPKPHGRVGFGLGSPEGVRRARSILGRANTYPWQVYGVRTTHGPHQRPPTWSGVDRDDWIDSPACV